MGKDKESDSSLQAKIKSKSLRIFRTTGIDIDCMVSEI